MLKLGNTAIFVLICVSFNSHAQNCLSTNISESVPINFIDHRDGTVSDISTGLMWQKCSNGQSGNNCSNGSVLIYSWQAALQLVIDINTGYGLANYKDWRLPNINELHSIVERQCYDPAINLTVFPATPSLGFWSSSPASFDSAYSWFVNFAIGYDNWDVKYDNYAVRLVRNE